MAVRQRPATAKGIVFISLEDESGLLDLVVKPEVWARLREVLRGELLLYVEGEVQRSGTAVSVLVSHAEPLLTVLAQGASAAAQPTRKVQRTTF